MDISIGIEKLYYNWDRISVKIPRPEGFTVIEEINYTPVTEWKGNEIGNFAFYLLKKVNRDHFSVIDELNNILHKKIRYLGIKDTNAITYQLIYTDAPSNIKEYNGKNFHLSFLGYYKFKISHTGNIFNIRLISDNEEEIQSRLTIISKNPYLPAYIGYQRFGTKRPITHVVGRYLLKKEWCKAIEYILSIPFYSESEIMRDVRKMIYNNNYKEAIRYLPSSFKQEKILLKNLIKTGNCYYALKSSKIPLYFYAEAYQSYLFNRYLSRKIDELRDIPDKDNFTLTFALDTSKCDEDCKSILDEEGICENEFKNNELKFSFKPITRKAFMKIRKLNYENGTLTFAIDRGMYATIFLKELLNTNPLEIT